MARQDLLGLLTGVQSTQQPISATNPQDWRMQFGQRQSEKMNQRLRGLTGRMSTQEALGAGFAKLDPNKPEYLKTITSLQRSVGDYAGAAKTATAMRELELEGKTRTAVATRLTKLGRTSEAQQILDRTMSTSVGQSLVLQLERDKRDAETKAAAALAKTEADRVGLLNTMSIAGISKDSEGYIAAQNGALDNIPSGQITSVINTLKKTENPEIKVTNLTPYQTPDGIVMAGQFTIDSGGGRVKRIFGHETAEGIEPIDLETSSKVTDKKLEGIKVSPTQVKNIMLRLATAGELGATGGGKKLLSKGFLVDANDAWNELSETVQYELGMAIAVRAEQYRKNQQMDQLKAETKAIKEIFTDNVEEDPSMFDFNLSDTLLNRSKVDAAIAEGPEQQLEKGTYTVILANGKKITVERE